MMRFLARRWFLLLLLGGGAWAWLRPGAFAWLRGLDPRVVVAAALFLGAWCLESRSLFRSLLRPYAALWAVCISFGLCPALGWLGGSLLSNDDLRVGLMIIASVPCTLTSAVIWTRMAGGSEATALLTILLTTATGALATTAWLTRATGAVEVVLDPAEMMRGLAMILLLPIGLGQSFRAAPPLARLATRFRRPIGLLAQALILPMVWKAVVEARQGRLQGLDLGAGPLLGVAALCIGIHLAALATGLWTGGGLGFDRPTRIAIAFAGSQKTLPVALFVLDRYFQKLPLAVLPLIVYHIGQLVVDTFIADGLAGRRPSEAHTPAETVV